MITVTLNLVGAGKVLLAGALLLWMALSIRAAVKTYQRRRGVEHAIAANLARTDHGKWNPKLTDEQIAQSRSLRRGVQLWKPPFKPAAALGWWIGGKASGY